MRRCEFAESLCHLDSLGVSQSDRITSTRHACGDQQHPDNANRFLRIVATVTQAVKRCRHQLQSPKPAINLAWCSATKNPRNRQHQDTAKNKAQQRRDQNKRDSFNEPASHQRAGTRFRNRSANQATDQGVRR